MAYQVFWVIQFKSIFVELQKYNNLTSCWGDKGPHVFPKGISSKVNVIARLEFELVNYDIATQHVSYFTTGVLPRLSFNVLIVAFQKEAQRKSTILQNKNIIYFTSFPFITQNVWTGKVREGVEDGWVTVVVLFGTRNKDTRKELS